MEFSKTKINDLFILNPNEYVDERGVFYRIYCKNEFSKMGINVDFVQINQSINFKKGTFRGNGKNQ